MFSFLCSVENGAVVKKPTKADVRNTLTQPSISSIVLDSRVEVNFFNRIVTINKYRNDKICVL
jgi:hypothetical protein